jgi:hypothetical protein
MYALAGSAKRPLEGLPVRHTDTPASSTTLFLLSVSSPGVNGFAQAAASSGARCASPDRGGEARNQLADKARSHVPTAVSCCADRHRASSRRVVLPAEKCGSHHESSQQVGKTAGNVIRPYAFTERSLQLSLQASPPTTWCTPSLAVMAVFLHRGSSVAHALDSQAGAPYGRDSVR